MMCHFHFSYAKMNIMCFILAEFINLISSESNEVCNREEKRTIAPEHVLKALEVSDRTIILFFTFLLSFNFVKMF